MMVPDGCDLSTRVGLPQCWQNTVLYRRVEKPDDAECVTGVVVAIDCSLDCCRWMFVCVAD